MIIRVKSFGNTFIDYEGIKSFELNVEGFLWLIREDGTDVFTPRDNIEWFQTIHDE